MTKAITAPALRAASALAGLTLKKGWDRMTDIDNAKVKLEAIGNSAEDVSKIMENATASVKGTAYGLNEAAQTAASAVAAGIKPGEELESYLSTVSDAAAVAGIDMGSMGSIFNKVATQGKASNEVLQQMAEAGIPVYQYLSEQLGVTASDVFEMASDGEISLSAFQKSVEGHIGGAAKTIGSKTITGTISNLKASISRIGANFLGSADDADSFAGRILPLLNDFMGSLGGVEEKAKKWGSVFGEVFGGIIDYCKTGKTNLAGLSDTAGGIVGKITPIIDTVKGVVSAFSGLSPKMQKSLMIGAVAGGPLLSILGKVSTSVGGAITGLGQLGGGLLKIGDTAGKGFKKLIPTPLIKAFGKIISPIAKTSSAVKGLTGGLKSMAGGHTKLSPLVSFFTKMVSPGLKVLSIIGKFAKFASIFGLVAAACVLVYKNFDKIKDYASKMAAKVSSALKKSGNSISTIKEKFSDVVAKVRPLIEKLVQTMGRVKEACQPVLDFLQSVFEAGVVSAFESIADTISTVIESIGVIFDGFMDLCDGIIMVLDGDFKGGFDKIFNGICEIVGGALNGLIGIVKTPLNTVINLVNKAIDGINSFKITFPDIVAKVIGVEKISFNIPRIPLLFQGTKNWRGGPVIINEPQYGGEIVDLPSGARVWPHDESIREARKDGGRTLHVDVAKLADQIVVREEADIDKITERLVKRIKEVGPNMA